MQRPRHLFLARATMTLLLALFTSIGAWAEQTAVTLTSDGNGGWYINMPANGSAKTVDNAAVLTLTTADLAAGKGIFKVYDDGGKSNYYSSNYEGYLIITAPEGYRVQVAGTVTSESTSWDWLTVYDGTSTGSHLGNERYAGQKGVTVDNLRSTGQSIMLYFKSDGSSNHAGLDLTATVFTPIGVASISGINDEVKYPVSNFSFSVKDYNGNTIDPSNYTVTLTLDGNPISEVSALGDYTLTVVGNASHPGTVSKSFKVLKQLDGNGTGESPYLINNDDDWTLFAEIVNSGRTYKDKFVRLENDVTATTVVGTSETNSFQGTFLGTAGKTLTLDITATGEFCAAFGYLKNATIKDLTVAGTITTAFRQSATIAGKTYGTITIENCISTADIVSSYSGYSHYGSIIARVENSKTQITNCVFAGKLLGQDAKGNGGFVGSSTGGSLYITNCLFAPGEITMGEEDCYTFCYNNIASLINCFYTTAYGKIDFGAEQVYAGVQSDFCKKEYNYNNTDYYSKKTTDIGNVNNTYDWNDSEYAITPTLKYYNKTLTEGQDYEYTISPATVKDVGSYTITFTGKGDYAGTVSKVVKVLVTLPGEGTSENPYTISNSADWDLFVDNINEGKTFSGQFVKMTDDITVTTMAGTSSEYSFQGTFMGTEGKTMTLDLSSTEDYCAPFKAVRGATIKDLNIAGSVTSTRYHSSSLVGCIYEHNLVTIDNCTSTATLNVNSSYNGGFVGKSCNNTNMTNCVFAGSILGPSTNNNSGFMGYSDYNNNNTYNNSFTNCLFKPTEVTSNSPVYNYTFTNAYYKTFTHCYYTTPFGEAQGRQVYTTQPKNQLCGQVTASDGADYYLTCDITGIEQSYQYNNGEEIAVTPVVSFEGTTLTNGTDYTVTFSSTPAAAGSYTLTVTGRGDYVGSRTISFKIVDGENLDGYVFATATDDDGTYYEIADEADLERLAAYVNSGHNASSKRFKQTAAITMTAEHTAIGNSNNYFEGTYDGANLTITGLTINKPYSDYQALFGYIRYASIKNVKLVNCNITGDQCIGGIVGRASGSSSSKSNIENCHVSGTIAAITTDAEGHGGIVGSTYYVTITGCTVTGTVSTTVENKFYGGIVGYATYTTITSCENAASISGNGGDHGGIVGYLRENISNCTKCLNTGTVEGTSSIGGVIGYYYSGSYSQCYYAFPCKTKAVTKYSNSIDDENAQRAFVINKGANISSISDDGSVLLTSALTGKIYCKNGNNTLTLTPIVGDDETFITYSCENGTLTNLTTVDGEHTLTINLQDVTINATVSSNNGIDISGATIAAIADQRWKGNAPVVPTLTVTYGDTPLVLGTDYLTECSDNAIGEATVTVRGINDFKGTTTAKFNIVDFDLLTTGPGSVNSEENPYKIETEADLEALASIVNTNARSGGYYRLEKDIDMKAEHTAIGHRDSPFKGYFDGNHKNIKNLTITKQGNTDADEYLGLFGYTFGATIKDVNIVDCNITGYKYIGGVVGYARGDMWSSDHSTISGCTVSGTIQNAESMESTSMGGIVGQSYYYSTVSDCISHATVNGYEFCGGIVGIHQGSCTSIENCFYTGVVTATKGYVGAIVGDNGYNSSMSNNYHTSASTGGAGEYNKTYGTDQEGAAELAVQITADDDVTLTLPAATYECNKKNYYKNGTVVTLDYETIEGVEFVQYTVNNGEISDADVKTGDHTLTGFTEDVAITSVVKLNLADNGKGNIAAINKTAGKTTDVTLTDRTLYKDGDWNTLCLPFDVTLKGSPLEGATVMKMDGEKSSLNNGKLSLSFVDEKEVLTAGTPYIIKWETKGDDIKDPVFTGVIISSTTPTEVMSNDNNVSFVGQYSPFNIVESGATGDNEGNINEIILLSAKNQLGYSKNPRTLHALRCHFKTYSYEKARSFEIDFGEGETTGIVSISDGRDMMSDGWYDLQGRKLDKQPAKKGLYIQNGKKVKK